MAQNTLDLKESFNLSALINDTYAKAKLNDVAFAAHATMVLGFPVSSSHVKARRRALGISSSIIRDGRSLAIKERIKNLEARVARLEAHLKHVLGD